MIGTIGIYELNVHCIIGIYPHERTKEQDLFLDISLSYDFKQASLSENVKDTIDYANLAEHITNLGVNNKYQLIETYAEEAATLVLSKFGATSVTIKIKKPGAVKNAAYPFVEITRTNL